MDGIQVLYRHFNKNGELLYVGISLNSINRLSQHKKNAHWFNDIARIELEQFPTRESALEAEKQAIINEKPLHNVHGSILPFIVKNPTLTKAEDSKDDLTKRIVQFDPIYSFNEAATIFGVGMSQIKKWITEGKLGCIFLGYVNGRWGKGQRRKITGWQIIDFIENLENENMTQEQPVSIGEIAK